jgi:hypothetical protein
MAVQSISVPPGLANILTAAGNRSGVDFDYLLQTAIRESSLNPAARARTSSAVGLFQFLESTWLQVMKEEGPRLGYGDIAQQIQRNSEGDYVVPDRAARSQILALREDPQVASDLAAAFTKTNGDFLMSRFGRMPSAGELYIAHFLGAQGAERLFTAGLSNPDQSAPALFPRQAAANPSIFYTDGQPRTVRELYQTLVAKHLDNPAATTFAAQQIASEAVAPAPAPPPLPSRFSPENMSFTGLFMTEPEEEVATDAGFFTHLYAQ